MQLELYQIVVILLAAAMIGYGIQRFLKREKGQTFLKLSVRIVIWGGMAVVVAFPHLTNLLAEIIGIQGNLNAVILTGFLLVFLMIFKLLSAVERLEQQITSLTRKESLRELPHDGGE